MVKDFIFDFIYFPFLLSCRDLLDVQRFCSVVFPHLDKLVIYHIFIYTFFSLASVTIIYFLKGVSSNDGPVQILAIHNLHYIHYYMKEIRMVPM